MRTIRILVTGSRSWRAESFIRGKLDTCLDSARELGDTLTVVHGACRIGADLYAALWVRWQRDEMGAPVVEEPHPADWLAPCRPSCGPNHRRPNLHGPGSTCPAAGFYRNDEMVALGANMCLAFIADESKGASHAATAAEGAGIETLRFVNTAATPTLF